MAKRINIGIIGLGNIGSSVAAVLRKNHSVIAENSGIDLRLRKVCDIRRRKTAVPFTRDPYEIIKDPEIAVVVEAIGGTKPALKFILAALNNGKDVVTPNKEVIAKHMKEIIAAARRNRARILFEGAVGGGIPIIQPLRESLAGNKLEAVYGIVNGTTNYILYNMLKEKMEFSAALKKAQEKGYAEPDPTADIKGYDAAYKAAILATIAFGVEVNLKDVYCEGITRIAKEDSEYARDIGYAVKLLAVAKMVAGKLDVRVHPALIQQSHPLAAVADNFNAIYIKGKPIGQLMFYGPGAGGGPTASAIISDIIQCAKGGQRQPIKLSRARIRKIETITSRYYIRLQVPDRPGVLAGIARVFAQKKVSIDAVVQKERIGNFATLVILLHSVPEKNLRAALKMIERLPLVRQVSTVIRIVS